MKLTLTEKAKSLGIRQDILDTALVSAGNPAKIAAVMRKAQSGLFEQTEESAALTLVHVKALKADPCFGRPCGVTGDIFADAALYSQMTEGNGFAFQRRGKAVSVFLTENDKCQIVHSVKGKRAGNIYALATRVTGDHLCKIFVIKPESQG